jgi:hypothetical protein
VYSSTNSSCFVVSDYAVKHGKFAAIGIVHSSADRACGIIGNLAVKHDKIAAIIYSTATITGIVSNSATAHIEITDIHHTASLIVNGEFVVRDFSRYHLKSTALFVVYTCSSECGIIT